MNRSGEQVALAFGEQRAVVVGLGAGPRTYSVGERPILDCYAADEVCKSGGAGGSSRGRTTSRTAATTWTGVRSSFR